MLSSRHSSTVGPVACLAVSLFWLGMLSRVSFLATSVKFQAASLSLPVALEVGRAMFEWFSTIEWVLAAMLVSVVLFFRLLLATRILAILTVALVLVQAVWLLPVLDARVDAVIAGRPLPPSLDHALYGSLEGLKAIALLVIAATGLASLASSRNGEETRVLECA